MRTNRFTLFYNESQSDTLFNLGTLPANIRDAFGEYQANLPGSYSKEQVKKVGIRHSIKK